MKKLFAFLLLSSCLSVSAGEWKVWADAKGGENRAYVGFDLLGVNAYEVREWAKFESYPSKALQLVTVPLDYAAYMVQEHPWQTLTFAVATSEATGNTHWTQDIINWFDAEIFDGKPEPETKDPYDGLRLDIRDNTAPVTYVNYNSPNASDVTIEGNSAPVNVTVGEPTPEVAI